MTIRSFAAALAVLALPVGFAAAHEYKLGALTVEHPYAIATPPMARTAAGYMTIDNAGPEPDRLIAIRAEVPQVQIHASEVDASGVARMHPVDELEIPASGSVTLSPQGMHVMFMGLTAPFEADTRVPATLVFEHAGQIAVEFAVEPRGAGEMDHDAMQHPAAKP